VLPQPGRAPRRVTNTRDDKARSSSFWRDSFEKRRCLVPVTCFAEPKEVTPATWHWFALNGEEPRPLFAFAGLWRRNVGPIKKDGPSVELDVYSFMTTTWSGRSTTSGCRCSCRVRKSSRFGWRGHPTRLSRSCGSTRQVACAWFKQG
jgi:hypothetical protein